MKKVIYVLCAGVILALSSCSSSPSDTAQKKADKAAATARDEAASAVEEEVAAEVDAANAIIDAEIALADELMAEVPMPELSSSDAKKYAKNIGNHIVEFINAKDASKAEDSESIKVYAASLLVAAEIAVL